MNIALFSVENFILLKMVKNVFLSFQLYQEIAHYPYLNVI